MAETENRGREVRGDRKINRKDNFLKGTRNMKGRKNMLEGVYVRELGGFGGKTLGIVVWEKGSMGEGLYKRRVVWEKVCI